MSLVSKSLKYLTYRYPLIFDKIRQTSYAYFSKLKNVSYPSYFDSSKNFATLEPINAEPANLRSFLFFVYWFETGGAESFALEMMRRLKAQGKTVYALNSVSSENSKIKLFQEASHFCKDMAGTVPSAQWYTFVTSLIRESKIDCVYIHHSAFAYKILPTLKKDFPNLRVIDSTHIIEYKNGGFVHESIRRSAHIDCHHTITPSLKSYYEKKFGVPAWKVIYFPLSFMSEQQPKIKLETGPDSLKNGKAKIVFLGRLNQQKRPYLFVEIAKNLLPEIKKRNLIPSFEIYGEGPQMILVKNQIRRLGLSEEVRILGEVHAKDIIFNNAFALILPSENEGLPLIFFEAIRYGVLPFATDVGQNKDFLNELFLVDTKHAFQIKEKILDAIDNPLRYVALLNEQREKIKAIDLNRDFNNNIEIFLNGTK